MLDEFYSRKVTWATLVELEFRLESLLAEAWSIGDDPKTRRHAAAWYGWGRPGLKAKLVSLIGWGRSKAALREDEVLLYSSHAYSVAYAKLYRACGC